MSYSPSLGGYHHCQSWVALFLHHLWPQADFMSCCRSVQNLHIPDIQEKNSSRDKVPHISAHNSMVKHSNSMSQEITDAKYISKLLKISYSKMFAIAKFYIIFLILFSRKEI